MKLKPLVLTVAVLAVLSLVTWFVRRPSPPPPPDPRVGTILLDADTIAKADRVVLTYGGKTVTLAKQDSDHWVVSEYYDFPVDFAKLSRLISVFKQATIQRLVTSNPDRIDRLEFGDTRIALQDSAGKDLWSLLIGRAAQGGGTFIEFPGETKAFLANFSAYFDADPENWVDHQLLDLKPDSIASVEINFPDENNLSLHFSRADKDKPFVAADGRQADKIAINNLVNLYTSARFSTTTEPGSDSFKAAQGHSRTLKFTTFDGRTVTIVYSQEPTPKPETPATTDQTTASADQNTATPATPPPAKPVFLTVSDSDTSSGVNALMGKRAFEAQQTLIANLPDKSAALFPSTDSSAKETDSGSATSK